VKANERTVSNLIRKWIWIITIVWVKKSTIYDLLLLSCPKKKQSYFGETPETWYHHVIRNTMA